MKEKAPKSGRVAFDQNVVTFADYKILEPRNKGKAPKLTPRPAPKKRG